MLTIICKFLRVKYIVYELYGGGTLDHAQCGQVGLLTNRSRACNYLSFCGVKSFIFSATESYYHATVMVSRKQHLKRISALAADGKRVAKRARQSRKPAPVLQIWIIPTVTTIIQLTLLNHNRKSWYSES